LKLYTGKTQLKSFLESIKPQLDNERQEYKKSAIYGRVKPLFHEVLLSKVIVLYLKKDSIQSNYLDADINEVKEHILHIEDIEILVLLDSFDEHSKINMVINWIALDLGDELSDYQNNKNYFFMMRHLKILAFLDAFKNKDFGEGRQILRIDFLRLEKMFRELVGEPVNSLIKNGSKQLYYSLFKIKTNEDQRNDIPIIEQKLEPIEYDDIEVTGEVLKNVYEYNCQICNEQHKVILSKSQRGKRGINKYIKVSDEIIRLNKDGDRFEIVCHHIDTKYEGTGKYFSFGVDRLKLVDLSSVEIDKVFIYQFFNFVHENDTIKYIQDGKEKFILVDELLEKFK
jgi:hypothetical protein